MFCSNCGNKLNEGADFCLNCGKLLKPKTPVVSKDNSVAFGILGFLFPLVGLILLIALKNSNPKDAKGAGIGAIIGLGVYLLLLLIIFGGLIFAIDFFN